MIPTNNPGIKLIHKKLQANRWEWYEYEYLEWLGKGTNTHLKDSLFNYTYICLNIWIALHIIRFLHETQAGQNRKRKEDVLGKQK